MKEFFFVFFFFRRSFDSDTIQSLQQEKPTLRRSLYLSSCFSLSPASERRRRPSRARVEAPRTHQERDIERGNEWSKKKKTFSRFSVASTAESKTSLSPPPPTRFFDGSRTERRCRLSRPGSRRGEEEGGTTVAVVTARRRRGDRGLNASSLCRAIDPPLCRAPMPRQWLPLFKALSLSFSPLSRTPRALRHVSRRLSRSSERD